MSSPRGPLYLLVWERGWGGTLPGMVEQSELVEYRALAERLADAAGAAIRPYFRQPIDVDLKADRSPVTAADREAEQAMRAILASEVPGHGMVGEEFGSERADADWVWVLDPVDGTKAFISGQPTFGTLVALLHQGAPLVGVIDQPISGERWSGAQGLPTTFNGEVIRARATQDLAAATLYATSPDQFAGATAEAFARLSAACGLTRFGLDCYAYGLLALGFVDLVAEADMKLYDFAALVPVVEGAGGVISDWAGRPLGAESDGRVLAAGDAGLHRAALGVLGETA